MDEKDKPATTTETIVSTDTVDNGQDKPAEIPTTSQVDLNAQLLAAQAKLKTLEEKVRNDSFEKVLRTHNVNPAFDEFIKWQLNWNDITDFNKAVTDFVANNPSVVNIINTGGLEQTIDTNPAPAEKENPLLKYKKENNL